MCTKKKKQENIVKQKIPFLYSWLEMESLGIPEFTNDTRIYKFQTNPWLARRTIQTSHRAHKETRKIKDSKSVHAKCRNCLQVFQRLVSVDDKTKFD